MPDKVSLRRVAQSVKSPRFGWSLILPIFAVLVTAPQAGAQAVSNASVTGRILDEQGAIVPGAQIRLTATETGIVHNAVANSDGIYSLPSLPIGTYTLQVSNEGFNTYVQNNLQLRVDDHVQINVTMRVGAVSLADR